jgi:hypothetical protein
MKIIKLKAENIKKLIAIEITPQGNVVKITGKNGVVIEDGRVAAVN